MCTATFPILGTILTSAVITCLSLSRLYKGKDPQVHERTSNQCHSHAGEPDSRVHGVIPAFVNTNPPPTILKETKHSKTAADPRVGSINYHLDKSEACKISSNQSPLGAAGEKMTPAPGYEGDH